MDMEKSNGYSIWLMPKGKIKKELSQIISKLSNDYSGPYFEPHVTLIGQVNGTIFEMLQKTQELATQIRPLKIELTSIEYHDEYFKNIFIKVKKTETIMTANHKALDIFNISNNQEYMPHLSIKYGQDTLEKKKSMIANIDKINFGSFYVTSIFLFSTKGHPINWKIVKEFKIK